MELINLASQLANNAIVQKNNQKVAKDLLPPLQKSRSYSDTKNLILPVKPMFIPYKFGEDRADWIMKYYVQWPIGFREYKQVTDTQMKKLAQDFLMANSTNNLHDDKYSIIVRADNEYIIFQFDIDRWLKDNFNSNPEFAPPISLDFKIKVLLPQFMYLHAPLNDFVKFIETKFKLYIREHKNKLYTKFFRFLKVISPEMFEFKFDIQKNHIRATIKYSVIIGALFLYTTYKHNKEIPKSQINNIKAKVSRLGDVSKLDKYLRYLK